MIKVQAWLVNWTTSPFGNCTNIARLHETDMSGYTVSLCQTLTTGRLKLDELLADGLGREKGWLESMLANNL